MSYVEPLPPLKVKKETQWYRFVGDSFLVLGSMLLLTEIISFFHLNQRIPDSFLVYLLLILAFASIRGLYAALLASFAAFFFYDFLFVPPAYSLLVSKFEDILALVVFLVTAIMTAQLASDLRRRAKEADRRERETHILYDLVRVTNREEGLLHQLHIFTRAVVDVFSPWGIRDCTLLLPDAEGKLVPQNTMRDPGDIVILSDAEEHMVAYVMKQAQTMDFHDGLQPDNVSNNAAGMVPQKAVGVTIRLVPLKTAHKVVGVLRLLIDDMRWPSSENVLSVGRDTHEALFFSTFLEQAVTVIERARLLRESVQMKVLQQTDALRAALLSSVSHDLRTPLATIKTAATSMLRMVLDEDAHNFASAIERESDRLNRLVENLLDMSRIEGGALHPKTVWYPLDELVHDVLGRMEVLLKGRVVNVHFPEELPPIELDYVQISQVLTNLLENAVRYTPDGSPIDISIETPAEKVLISIADRGPGISFSERERIFDKFYRVHREPAAADQFRGSGLGLAVCRGLVEAHGGRIWGEGGGGGGGVFRFTLPRRAMEENCNE